MCNHGPTKAYMTQPLSVSPFHRLCSLFLEFSDEFVNHLLGKDFQDASDREIMASAIKSMLPEGGLKKGMNPILDAARTAPPTPKPKAMSDDEFILWHHVRKVFHAIDNNNNGTLDQREFQRLMRQIGIKVIPSQPNPALTPSDISPYFSSP